jgi:hypothetical protein
VRPGGAVAGSAQLCSRQARENGVNTRYGAPSWVRTRPGPTAYGEPVGTQSIPRSVSLPRTASSRRTPYGVVSALTWTEPAPTSQTKAATVAAGSPTRTVSRPW